MQFVNLTGEKIVIEIVDPRDPSIKFDSHLTFQANQPAAVVKMDDKSEYELADVYFMEGSNMMVKTVKSKYGDVINLPEPAENTAFIVNEKVARALPDRTDLYVPDMDTAVVDKMGEVLRITQFIQFANPDTKRIQELEQSIEDKEDAEMRHEEYRQQKEAERVHYANLANESVEREMQHLTEKNMDLQDEIANKDHQWGTSRK